VAVAKKQEVVRERKEGERKNPRSNNKKLKEVQSVRVEVGTRLFRKVSEERASFYSSVRRGKETYALNDATR